MRHFVPLLLAALMSLTGCPSETEDAPSPDEQDVRFKVYVSLRERVTDLPTEGLKVSLDDKSIGKVTPDEPFVTVELPADTFGVDLAKRLTAAVPTSCGAEKVELRPYYATKKEEVEYRAKYATADQKHSMSFSVAPIDEAYVYVDNVGGKERKLSIGKLEIDLPQDAPLRQRVRIGPCAKGKKVRIDGKDVGELSMKERTPKSLPATLVDAVGGRCYRRTQRFYREVGTAATGGTTPPETYKGERTYAIEHPNDFLEASPKEYEKRADPDGLNLPLEWRIELNRCDGTPKRGGPLG